MNLCELEGRVEKVLSSTHSRGDVLTDVLTLFFIARVKEGMEAFQSHLEMSMTSFGIIISGVQTSEELVWLYNLTFKEYFDFNIVSKHRHCRVVSFTYKGEPDDKLRAWKAMAYALDVFKEEITTVDELSLDETIDRVLTNTPKDLANEARMLLAKV